MKEIKLESTNEDTSMDRIFINFTNHPSDSWLPVQTSEAQKYGKIVDVPFPIVDPCGDEQYIDKLADQYEQIILKYRPTAVLCQGEFCMAYQMISRLKRNGVEVVAACSERIVHMKGDFKTSVFEFQRFRRL